MATYSNYLISLLLAEIFIAFMYSGLEVGCLQQKMKFYQMFKTYKAYILTHISFVPQSSGIPVLTHVDVSLQFE